MGEKLPIMECIGGPWDGDVATALKALSYRGFASGQYVVVARSEPDPRWGEMALVWRPA